MASVAGAVKELHGSHGETPRTDCWQAHSPKALSTKSIPNPRNPPIRNIKQQLEQRLDEPLSASDLLLGEHAGRDALEQSLQIRCPFLPAEIDRWLIRH